MKANELMVGDLVYSTFCDKPCKVVGIEQYESEYAVVKVTNVSGAKDIQSLTPIPLTPEILEKNEFNILRDAYGMSDPFWSYSNRSVLVDVTIIRTNNVKVIDWFNVKISTRNDIKQISFCGVKYVYQLQHALRLCGIEKEIVL